MKKIIILILFSCLAFSQKYEISGKLIDKSTNTPIQFASILIKGTTKGTVSNLDGCFKFKLKKGVYTFIISHLSYEPDSIKVNIVSNQTITLSLKLKDLYLSEIVVSAEEDPAYSIIREAIKRKEINRKGLKSYKYEAYTRNVMSSKDTIISVEENISEGFFESPDWFKEKLIYSAVTENRKKTGRGNVEFTNRFFIDFSADSLMLLLNKVYLPLYKNSFDYYDFKLVGTYGKDANLIYKIQVIPKSEIQPLLKGFINIEGNNYNLVGVNLKANKGVRFVFINDIKIDFEQTLSKYSNYWLPNFIKSSGSFKMNLAELLKFDKISFKRLTAVNQYTINVEIPDSIKNPPPIEEKKNKKESYIELNQIEISRLRKIPLSNSEKIAYKSLDSTKTLDKLIKPKGALASLVKINNNVENQKKSNSFLSNAFRYLDFDNTKISGIMAGIKYNKDLFNKKFNLDFSIKYAFGNKKIYGNTLLTFNSDLKLFNKLRLKYFNDIFIWNSFDPSGSLIRSINSTLGFNDQFNYTWQKGFSFQLKKENKNYNYSIAFTSRKYNNLPLISQQSIFTPKSYRRINPNVANGTDNYLSAKILIGKNPFEFQLRPENGLIINFDYSDKTFNSDFNYKRLEIFGQYRMPTFYKELFIAPYLLISMHTGIISGNYGLQHNFSPLFSYGSYAPNSTLKGLSDYRFRGNKLLTFQIEHNWRSIIFQGLGIDFLSDRFIEILTGFTINKTWSDSLTPSFYKQNKMYWEANLGISRILGLLRFDVIYNSFKEFNYKISSAIFF